MRSAVKEKGLVKKEARKVVGRYFAPYGVVLPAMTLMSPCPPKISNKILFVELYSSCCTDRSQKKTHTRFRIIIVISYPDARKSACSRVYGVQNDKTRTRLLKTKRKFMQIGQVL